jgi:single-strand DNA-binding protein
MYNQVTLIGNLTRDVEVRYTQSGAAVGNTGIATTHRWKSANGEQKEETMFIDLTFFGRTAEIANQYLHKGSKVFITGRLKLDQWEANDGTKRSKHTVVVQEMKMLSHKEQSAPQPQQQIPDDVGSDEIPF